MDHILNILKNCNPLIPRRQREGYLQLNEVNEPTEQTPLLPTHQRNTETDGIPVQDTTDCNIPVGGTDQGAKEKNFRTGEGYRSFAINEEITQMKKKFFRPSRNELSELLVEKIKEFADQKVNTLAFSDESENYHKLVMRTLAYNQNVFKEKLDSIREKIENVTEHFLFFTLLNDKQKMQKDKEKLFLLVDLLERFEDRLNHAPYRSRDTIVIPYREDGKIDSVALYETYLNKTGRISQKAMDDLCNDFIQNYDDERLFVLINEDVSQSWREIDTMWKFYNLPYTGEEIEKVKKQYNQVIKKIEKYLNDGYILSDPNDESIVHPVSSQKSGAEKFGPRAEARPEAASRSVFLYSKGGFLRVVEEIQYIPSKDLQFFVKTTKMIRALEERLYLKKIKKQLKKQIEKDKKEKNESDS